MNYVKVVIDNNSDMTDSLYTYKSHLPLIQVGDKVMAPFGRGNKAKEAYVFEVSDTDDDAIKNLKEISSVDEAIRLGSEAVSIAKWMRDRYFCRYSDAIKCFTPSGTSSKRGKLRNPYKECQGEDQPISQLTAEQKNAMDRIKPYIRDGVHKTFLIHGVTSSGKTEIYMRAIAEAISQGRTAIMLVPEIALTKQTIDRFIGRFGYEHVAVLHSKLSLGERYDEWMRARNGQVKIVIGARSGIFAPLDHLGVIIIDEEHETTYKSDMTPKYDTLEVAIERAKLSNAVVLLGSATPSLVSYYRSETQAYERITLLERFNQTPLPQVEVVDMRSELKNGNKSILSMPLYTALTDCLALHKQAILFLNRRGYSTFVSCRSCGYVMTCGDCGVALTFHKGQNRSVCHYCGHRENVPVVCPVCKGKYIRHFGTGTEKVEEKISELFPQAAIGRLDLDTTREKGSTDKILAAFKKGKTDILIGTQLVAKGLDFANVGLVGIVSADISLNIPDFRSSERTFQLITQAAGRAGRGNAIGRVIIQTYTPEHYAIIAAAAHDYSGFYERERMVRKQMLYPPFSEIIQIMVLGEEDSATENTAVNLAAMIREAMGPSESRNILGPQAAHIAKQNNHYRYQILIKASLDKSRIYEQKLREIRQTITMDKGNQTMISIDLNPYSFI
jgi:primosomal protein N' (replication factor Y)